VTPAPLTTAAAAVAVAATGRQSKRCGIEPLRAELREYCTVFEPIATYINSIADVDHSKPWLVTSEEQCVLDQLEAMAENAESEWIRQAAAKLAEEWKTYKPPIGDSTSLFEAISWMSPCGFIDAGCKPTAADFTERTKIEVSQTEWTTYAEMVFDRQPGDGSRPQQWWERHAKELPQLSKIALFLLSLPVVVTKCDSILSLATTLWCTRQQRLDPVFAGRWLQWCANGDFSGQYQETARGLVRHENHVTFGARSDDEDDLVEES